MHSRNWPAEFPAAITVCDADGKILEMNAKSAKVFAKSGGTSLIGANILDCHPEPAKTKLRKLMETRQTNAYTIEKNGVKKLIYQAPWFEKGEYRGFVEISMEIPKDMPHFARKT
jgi:transcriptional regulator with PAS, ATPase and Fis domain